jgi:uncharacterized delta-60 repeat protein
VNAVVLQPDGQILVAGRFQTVGTERRAGLARLRVDGSLDPAFAPEVRGIAYVLGVQQDGRILVGGLYGALCGKPRQGLGRLNPDGSLDETFRADVLHERGTGEATIVTLVVQADGGMLVGGQFTELGGQPRKNIARIRADGSLDETFNPGANAPVVALAIQADGAILAGGPFEELAGVPRARLARLRPSGNARTLLDMQETVVRWANDGSGPLLHHVLLEATTDGRTWAALGAAQRVEPAGGPASPWELRGAQVPRGATVRARGSAGGGFNAGSGSMYEVGWGPPVLVQEPESVTLDFGGTAHLLVRALGSSPLHYTWTKGGRMLERDHGETEPGGGPLVLNKLTVDDAAEYGVVVSNDYGSATSRLARVTVRDPIFKASPQDLTVHLGGEATLSATAAGTEPFTYQWLKNGTPLAGCTRPLLQLHDAKEADAGNYAVVVQNERGRSTSTVARVIVNAHLPDAFAPDPDGEVLAITVQPDGKSLLGGNFHKVGGEPRLGLARLYPDGSLDPTFAADASAAVVALALLDEGRILAGGDFVLMGGQQCERIGCLNADGTLVPDFKVSADRVVAAFARQTDGRILVGGGFSKLNGQPRRNVGRLNKDGTLDTTFDPSPSYLVTAIAVQPDGRILLGGAFNTIAGKTRNYLARLNPDGSLDESFDPDMGGVVDTLALQPDGRILIGGAFVSVGKDPRIALARLNPDGTVDPSFKADANGAVMSIHLEANGGLLVGGGFTQLAGRPRNRVARLTTEGLPDETFDPGADGRVHCLAVQADGRVLVGGAFGTLAGQPRISVGRLQ